MKICMIGAGAMGGVYGGLLARSGVDVTLIDNRADHVAAIRRDGLRIEGVRGDHSVRMEARTDADGLAGSFDLAIVFTDSSATVAAAGSAAAVLRPDGFAMTLQNGIGNVEHLVAVLGRDRVVAGVSMNSAASAGPGHCTYTNVGMTSIGELDGRDSDRIREVARLLDDAGIPTEIVPDPMSYIWSKFVLNCGINALTAVTGLRSGEMYRTPEVSALQDRVIDEILMVVARKGLRLAEADPRKKIKDHCRVRYNRPSMMQHIEQGRRTEIDAINGALVREAQALGLAVPYNEAIVAIVKGLEKSRRQRLHEPPIDYARREAEAEAEVQKRATAP